MSAVWDLIDLFTDSWLESNKRANIPSMVHISSQEVWFVRVD